MLKYQIETNEEKILEGIEFMKEKSTIFLEIEDWYVFNISNIDWKIHIEDSKIFITIIKKPFYIWENMIIKELNNFFW